MARWLVTHGSHQSNVAYPRHRAELAKHPAAGLTGMTDSVGDPDVCGPPTTDALRLSVEEEVWLDLALHRLLLSGLSEADGSEDQARAQLIAHSLEVLRLNVAEGTPYLSAADLEVFIAASPAVQDSILRKRSVDSSRARALLLAIEVLAVSDAVSTGSGRSQRQIVAALLPLEFGVAVALADDWDRVSRRLAAKSRSLESRALVFAGGVAVTAAVTGVATAAVVAFAPAAAGLSGAAAASAALASVGGGSVATGGFGVAGGLHVLTAVGHATGVATKRLSARFLIGRRQGVFAELAKVDLAARHVLRDELHDQASLLDLQEQVAQRATAVAEQRRPLDRELRTRWSAVVDLDLEIEQPLVGRPTSRLEKLKDKAERLGRQARMAPTQLSDNVASVLQDRQELLALRAQVKAMEELERGLRAFGKRLEKYGFLA